MSTLLVNEPSIQPGTLVLMYRPLEYLNKNGEQMESTVGMVVRAHPDGGYEISEVHSGAIDSGITSVFGHADLNFVVPKENTRVVITTGLEFHGIIDQVMSPATETNAVNKMTNTSFYVYVDNENRPNLEEMSSLRYEGLPQIPHGTKVSVFLTPERAMELNRRQTSYYWTKLTAIVRYAFFEHDMLKYDVFDDDGDFTVERDEVLPAGVQVERDCFSPATLLNVESPALGRKAITSTLHLLSTRVQSRFRIE